MSEPTNSNNGGISHAIRFAHINPQMTVVHPNYERAVVADCSKGLVLCAVDCYRKTVEIIRRAGYRKAGITASGNTLTISTVKVGVK